MINDKWQICMNWEPIMVWPDWYLYLESFLISKKQRGKEKQKYLDYIYITEDEYILLIDLYWDRIVKDYMEKLNSYIGSKGKKYKSHYHTLISWLKKDWAKKVSNLAKEVVEYDKTNNFTDEQRAIAMAKLQSARDTILWRTKI